MADPLMYVEMAGVGADRMDTRGPFGTAANPRPERCPHCSFPDIEAVPEPYLLVRKTVRPTEASDADLGNFFVQDRPRAILEAVVPGACRFYPTFDAKTKEQTPWSLAVPVGQVSVADIIPTVPRCPACGEPKLAHKGVHFRFHVRGPVALDVFKMKEWYSAERTAEDDTAFGKNALMAKTLPPPREGRWTRLLLGRDFYFSVRLETLFKEAGVKGIVRSVDQAAKPSADDRRWIDAALAKLGELGLIDAKPAPAGGGSAFDAYLKANGKAKGAVDFPKVEAKLGRPLPASYKAFIERVGPKTFKDIDGEEGFVARVLPPAKLDLEGFREGAIEFDPDDADSRKVDGLPFAATDHGDAFVFDLASGVAEPPVLRYDHESNLFEPYAPDFERCVLQWASAG